MTDAFLGFCFCRCFISLKKILELTFSGHEPMLCGESSVSIRISVNVV